MGVVVGRRSYVGRTYAPASHAASHFYHEIYEYGAPLAPLSSRLAQQAAGAPLQTSDRVCFVDREASGRTYALRMFVRSFIQIHLFYCYIRYPETEKLALCILLFK